MLTVSGIRERHPDKTQFPASHIALQVCNCSTWPDARGATLIDLCGSLEVWASRPFDELLQAIERLPKEAIISLQIDAAETNDNPAAFELIARIQKRFSDRSYVDFKIAPTDTFYPQTETERRRSAYLSDAAAHFTGLGAPVRWLIPLTHSLVYKLETFFLRAQCLAVEAMISKFDANDLDRNDRLFAADFVRYHILEEASGLLSLDQRQGYEALLKILDGADARNVDDICSRLLSVGPQAIRGRQQRQGLDFVREATGVLFDGARAHLLRLFTPKKRDIKSVAAAQFKKVLLIGAYGGEHIGDAAILGGVAFRLRARHGVTQAILMSQRPDHTRHLIPMIETPVEIEVREYLHSEIDASIDEVDAVIFAGGPIVDLPKQLVRHLYAVSRAKARGKPFLMEGVGPGPLHRLPSRATVRRIISLADYVAVRTQESAGADILKGQDVVVGRDPAFDYLETRQDELSRMPTHEVREIERLLDGANSRPVIGVNIRPIYHQYTVGVKEADKASYTEMIEDRFERRLAEALTQFSRNNSTKPVIVLFPMNAIQFGLSDLKSAFRIGRHLGNDVDYRVWESDASLDGVLALIRRLDVAITMRFHATIFALSQGVETIGVDYRIGERDKVAAVLSDAGKGDQCVRIDEMTIEWMTSQLQRLAGAASKKLKTG